MAGNDKVEIHCCVCDTVITEEESGETLPPLLCDPLPAGAVYPAKDNSDLASEKIITVACMERG